MISFACGIYKLLFKDEFIDTENRLVVARGRGWGTGKMGERGHKVQTSSWNIRPRNIMMNAVNNTVLHI